MNLIPDWQCDRVVLVLPTRFMEYYDEHLSQLELFYADFMTEIARYDSVICLVPDRDRAKKMMQLTNLGSNFFPIAKVEDIWVRDFALIQSVNSYWKFKFNPSYESKTNNEYISSSFIKFVQQLEIDNLNSIDLCLEGGNLIHNGKGIAITTNKIYRQNQDKTPDKIAALFKDKLGIKRLVVVPTEPGDRTGHIDGMMRWIDERRLLINDYCTIYPHSKFVKKLKNCLALQLPDIELVVLPYLPETEKHKGWYSAVGNYINYLRTKNRVYVPVFINDVEPRIRQIYQQNFARECSFIISNSVARYGGLLNCITWNYKK